MKILPKIIISRQPPTNKPKKKKKNKSNQKTMELEP
jgi:hypothetical protein